MYFSGTLKCYCDIKILTWYSREISRSWTQGVNDTHGWKHWPQVELVLYFEPGGHQTDMSHYLPRSFKQWERLSRLPVVSTSAEKYPSWSCAGRCPTRPSDELWAATLRRTAASSSRWVAPPAGSGNGPGTAALTQCSADPVRSWTDLVEKSEVN